MNFVKIFSNIVRAFMNCKLEQEKEVTGGKAFNLHVHLFKMVFYSEEQKYNIHY